MGSLLEIYEASGNRVPKSPRLARMFLNVFEDSRMFRRFGLLRNTSRIGRRAKFSDLNMVKIGKFREVRENYVVRIVPECFIIVGMV